jgi:plastocyanin
MSERHRARLAFSVAAIGAFVLALAVPTVLAADRGVAIRDFAFSPRTVEIRVGDSVTWTNHDGVEHTATARNGSFDTGLLGEGESRAIRFNVAGTYRYVCTPHPSMTGTIVVRAASGGVRPPNTDTAVGVAADDGGSEDSRLPALAVLGGLAYLVAHRAIRRRRETA